MSACGQSRSVAPQVKSSGSASSTSPVLVSRALQASTSNVFTNSFQFIPSSVSKGSPRSTSTKLDEAAAEPKFLSGSRIRARNGSEETLGAVNRGVMPSKTSSEVRKFGSWSANQWSSSTLATATSSSSGSSASPNPYFEDLTEEELEKAVHALSYFFSSEQVHAIAAAPQSAYSRVLTGIASVQQEVKTSVGSSLRMALSLLGGNSPHSNAFRSRLLASKLASHTERDTTGVDTEPLQAELNAFAELARSQEVLLEGILTAPSLAATSTSCLSGKGSINPRGVYRHQFEWKSASDTLEDDVLPGCLAAGGSSWKGGTSSQSSSSAQARPARHQQQTAQQLPGTGRQSSERLLHGPHRGIRRVASFNHDGVPHQAESAASIRINSAERLLQNSRLEGMEVLGSAAAPGSFAACATAALRARRDPQLKDALHLGYMRMTYTETVESSKASPEDVNQATSVTSAVTSAPAPQVVPSRRPPAKEDPPQPGQRGGSSSTCRSQSAGRRLPSWPDSKRAGSRERSAEIGHRSRLKRTESPSLRSTCSPAISSRGVLGVPNTNSRHSSPLSARESPSPMRRGLSGSKSARFALDEKSQRESSLQSSSQTGSCLSPAKALRRPGQSRKDSKELARDTKEKESPRRCRQPQSQPQATSPQIDRLLESTRCSPTVTTLQAIETLTLLTKKDSSSGELSRQAALKKEGREGVQRAIASQSQGPTTNSLEFYAIGKLLGKGAFGKVNIGVHKLTEELTALKQCESRRMLEVGAKKCLTREVGIIKRLSGHPNIIQLFEVIENSLQVVLVMEFAPGGDLLRYVRQRRRLNEKCAQDLFKQMMDGIAHIHAMRVVHRDIKLDNILLDSFGCVKIADFGVAVIVENHRRLQEHCGTPSYIAPEILRDAGYEGQPVDVWSAGIVLYAMLCGRVPFKGDNLQELKRCIVRGRFQIPPYINSAAASLVSTMLTVDPRTRPCVPAVLLHNWLEGVKNRAEYLYSIQLRSQPPEDGKPEGRLILPTNNEATQALLEKLSDFGFQQAFVEESLREGSFNHATATFHLLSQQHVRKNASLLAASGSSIGGLLPIAVEEGIEEECEDDGEDEVEGLRQEDRIEDVVLSQSSPP